MGFKPLELGLIVSGRFLSLSDLGSSTAASTSTDRGGGEEAQEEMAASLLLGHLHRSGTQLGGGTGVVFAGGIGAGRGAGRVREIEEAGKPWAPCGWRWNRWPLQGTQHAAVLGAAGTQGAGLAAQRP
ncbi:hypothetical protein GQ55_3G458400 [Panicum hallii var. hallii]|uniref:Uncharacterized protein n=1 Tax=Panicum hallii var. hallii TaxID=1504633 RepID=A0A2T7EIR6_9POAL|nr:hypothetical protein GQ55_3G458400 [Panicum hallii var. hallii]